MSKARWSPKDFKDNGLIEVNGLWVKASTQVAKGKVDKLPLMNNNVNLSTSIEEPKANRKIKNATKSVIDGVKFDSRLEEHLYMLLKGAGIEFDFQKVYWLMENFKYCGETVRGIKIIMDFWLPTRNILIDSKGWQTYDGKLKHKMLKQYLKTVENNEPEILMPSTKKECDLIINRLLYQS